MIDVKIFMNRFLQALDKNFGSRVWFVGLQGSYGRGEATENSDIDLVVILDELNAADILIYDAMMDSFEQRGLLCGFLSGKNEILNWEPSDLFQFYYDTAPVRGSLDALLSLLDSEAVARAIKIGACNVFHGCVHNMLYEKSDEVLKGLYKAASFVVQAIFFQQTGIYLSCQKELIEAVPAEEKVILETFAELKNGGKTDFTKMSETLFAWAQKIIRE